MSERFVTFGPSQFDHHVKLCFAEIFLATLMIDFLFQTAIIFIGQLHTRKCIRHISWFLREGHEGCFLFTHLVGSPRWFASSMMMIDIELSSGKPVTDAISNTLRENT